MYKLLLISGLGCAGCSSLHMEVKEVLKQYPQLHYEEYSIENKKDGVQKIIDTYHLEKIPTLLLLKDDKELGKVSGYQPAEILSYWLEDKLKSK